MTAAKTLQQRLGSVRCRLELAWLHSNSKGYPPSPARPAGERRCCRRRASTANAASPVLLTPVPMFAGATPLAMPLRGLQRLAFGEGACSDPKSPSRDRSSSSHAAGSAAHLGTEISATSASAPLPRALADDRGCAAGAGGSADLRMTCQPQQQNPRLPAGTHLHAFQGAL